MGRSVPSCRNVGRIRLGSPARYPVTVNASGWVQWVLGSVHPHVAWDSGAQRAAADPLTERLTGSLGELANPQMWVRIKFTIIIFAVFHVPH